MSDRTKTDPDIRVSPEPEGEGLPRRDLLKMGAAGLGLAALGACTPSGKETGAKPRLQRPDLGSAPEQPFAAPPMDLVRIGYVGTGLQGTGHVRNLNQIEGCQITAVCDIVPEKAERAANMVEEAGFPRPAIYTDGERGQRL